VHGGAFVVPVARVRRAGDGRLHEVLVGEFDPDGTLGPASPVETAVPEHALAECDVVLETFTGGTGGNGGIMAKGTVRAPWHGVCRRCAAEVDGEVVATVKERFVEEADLDPDDDAYPIENDALDLSPMVRDAVLLELPAAPLCRPDCKGLCPWCGTDLNERPCGCVAPRDPRWANLDVLREHAREGI
jgi:uncharacterized protein